MEHQSQSYHVDSTSIYSNLDSILKKIVRTPQILTQVNCVYLQRGPYETGTNQPTMQFMQNHQLEGKKKYRTTTTCGACAIEKYLLRGDHGEPRAGGLRGGIAELGPGAALDGVLGAAHRAYLLGGGDLHLVALGVDPILDHLLDALGVGPDDDRRREEHAEVEVVVVQEIAPPFGVVVLLLRHGCHRWRS